MANPWAGEVAVELNGVRHVARLTLGALAELEADMSADSLVELAERFEAARFSATDVGRLLTAGLRGGGAAVELSDVMSAEIGGGPSEAARVAGQLLARAFGP